MFATIHISRAKIARKTVYGEGVFKLLNLNKIELMRLSYHGRIRAQVRWGRCLMQVGSYQ